MKKDAVMALIFLIAIYGVTVGMVYATAVTTVTLNPTKDSYAWESVPECE